jgi:hypothetical protein
VQKQPLSHRHDFDHQFQKEWQHFGWHVVAREIRRKRIHFLQQKFFTSGRSNPFGGALDHKFAFSPVTSITEYRDENG